MSAVVEAREPTARYWHASQTSALKQLDLLVSAPCGVAHLRELVLSLALQGQLVPQNSNDPPAALILVRAHHERSRLASAVRAAREKPVEVVGDDEAPFSLPHGWVWCRLGQLAFPQAGFAFKSSGFNEIGAGLPLIRIRDVGADGRPTTFFSGEYRSEFLVETGDWLISMDGAFRVRRWHSTAALLNQRVTRLIFFSSDVVPQFISMALQRQLTELQGTKAYTTVDHLSGKQISDAIIGLPSFAEQARIVARVDELMKLCDALEAKGRLEAEQHARLLEALLGTLTDSTTPEELADNWQRVAEHFDLLFDRPEAVDELEQTILQFAARGLLVPRDPVAESRCESTASVSATEQLFEVPQAWAWVRIEDIATVLGGIQKTPARRPVHSHVPYLRVANVQRDALDLRAIERFEVTAEEVERWGLRPGDLLIVEGNGSEHEIGRSAIWTGDIQPCVYQNHLIRVRCDQPAVTRFLQLFLNSPDGKAEMKRLAITTSGLYNLSVGKIRRFAVALPPLPEQARIVARVAELRLLCADLRQRLTASQATQSRLAEALVDAATA